MKRIVLCMLMLSMMLTLLVGCGEEPEYPTPDNPYENAPGQDGDGDDGNNPSDGGENEPNDGNDKPGDGGDNPDSSFEEREDTQGGNFGGSIPFD